MMQERIYTSEKMQGDATGMTPWQRERMGRVEPMRELPMTRSEKAYCLLLVFAVTVFIAGVIL